MFSPRPLLGSVLHCYVRIERGGVGELAAPAVLGLDHVAPEEHLAEYAPDDPRLVAPGQVDERGLRLACGVDPARALECRSGMAVRAGGGERPPGLPHVVVQHGLEPAVRA